MTKTGFSNTLSLAIGEYKGSLSPQRWFLLYWSGSYMEWFVQQQRLRPFREVVSAKRRVGEGLLLPGARLEGSSRAKIFVRRWTLVCTKKEYLNPLSGIWSTQD